MWAAAVGAAHYLRVVVLLLPSQHLVGREKHTHPPDETCCCNGPFRLDTGSAVLLLQLCQYAGVLVCACVTPEPHRWLSAGPDE